MSSWAFCFCITVEVFTPTTIILVSSIQDEWMNIHSSESLTKTREVLSEVSHGNFPFFLQVPTYKFEP